MPFLGATRNMLGDMANYICGQCDAPPDLDAADIQQVRHTDSIMLAD